MALKWKIQLEDLILGTAILFTFLYPFIITALILFEEAEKEEKEEKILKKFLTTFTSENCEQKILRLVPYTTVSVDYLRNFCKYVPKKEIKKIEKKREGDEVIFIVKLNDGILEILGKWEGRKFKIIYIHYGKGY